MKNTKFEKQMDSWLKKGGFKISDKRTKIKVLRLLINIDHLQSIFTELRNESFNDANTIGFIYKTKVKDETTPS